MLVVVESQTGIFSFNIETPFSSERGVLTTGRRLGPLGVDLSALLIQ